MKKKWITPVIIVAVIVMLIAWCVSSYNSLVTQEEGVNTAWSNVENQYQRRSDLIPNLVNTVKGYAAHEKETLDAVVSARAKATQTHIDPENLTTENIAAYQQAQNAVGSALSRLLVTVERYKPHQCGTPQVQRSGTGVQHHHPPFPQESCGRHVRF